MKKLLPFLLLLISYPCLTEAQDPHFTQFFSSPLTLNPAFTGYFSGDLRIAGNYRNQWSSVATPFITGTVSADFSILRKQISENDIWGMGVLGLYDKTGGGGLRNNLFSLSTAYHKALDVDGVHTLGIGAQISFVQKRLDFSKLIFENQLTNQGFDPSISSGENIPNSRISYPDYNVGILYNGLIGESSNIYLGASYYHITQPTESFLGQNNRLASRYTIHGGGSFAMSNVTRFHTSFIYMRQASASEISLGGAIGILTNGLPETPTIFYVGSWYRVNDAINPYIGLEINNVQVGISYDVNTSSLKPASNYRGGMEISVIYIKQHAEPSRRKLYCPKF